MHGKQSRLQGQAERQVMRYHSLMIDPDELPQDLEVTDKSEGCIMAVRHKRYPIFGLQFHPESIGTEDGASYINQFLQKAGI